MSTVIAALGLAGSSPLALFAIAVLACAAAALIGLAADAILGGSGMGVFGNAVTLIVGAVIALALFTRYGDPFRLGLSQTQGMLAAATAGSLIFLIAVGIVRARL